MRLRSLAFPLLAVATVGCAQERGASVADGGAEAAQAEQAATAAGMAPPDAPVATLDEGADALPTLARSRGSYYGSELEGFSAEEFYWMNGESSRWPDDVDPRDNSYLPSPVPNVTFELE